MNHAETEFVKNIQGLLRMNHVETEFVKIINAYTFYGLVLHADAHFR